MSECRQFRHIGQTTWVCIRLTHSHGRHYFVAKAMAPTCAAAVYADSKALRESAP